MTIGPYQHVEEGDDVVVLHFSQQLHLCVCVRVRVRVCVGSRQEAQEYAQSCR